MTMMTALKLPQAHHKMSTLTITIVFVNIGPQLLSLLIQIIGAATFITNEDVPLDRIFLHALYKHLKILSLPSKTRDIPMETPIVNENGMLAKKLNELQNDLQNHHNRKQTIDERITYLHREVKSLI
jgi:hypothetical protein